MPPVAVPSPQDAIRKGIAFQKAGNLAEAARVYSGLLREDAANADAWHLLGTIELSRGRFDVAHDLISQALSLQPDNAIFLHNLAYVLGAKSRMDEAVAAYRRAVALKPDYAEAIFNLSQSVRIEPGDPLIAAVEALLPNPDLSQSDRCFIEFAAGRVYASLGEYDRAFRHYTVGNAARGAKPNPNLARRFFERIQAVCDKSFLQSRFGGGAQDAEPVFIVGMPRSGTTLAEQILASHPEVHGGGELPLIERACGALQRHTPGPEGYPECLPRAPERLIADLAQNYLDLTGAGGARVTTDKAPLNFRHLGLIALLFPKARIVHCRRDPLDTCLSCFFQKFANGQEYSFDQTTLGEFYCDYRRMMDRWADVLPIPVFDLVYEDLVADLEGVGHRLLEFCGLDWHPDCARFFETDRPILTASRFQVRRPVYATSIGKWRNYEKHLEPLIAALGDYATNGDA